MKATVNFSSVKTMVLTIAVITLFAVQCTLAQKPGIKAFTSNKYALENLAAAFPVPTLACAKAPFTLPANMA